MSGSSRSFRRLVPAVALLAAALALAGCGRKGPLDPPPGASLEDVAQPHKPDLMSGRGVPAYGTQPGALENRAGTQPVGSDGQPARPPRKTIPLDALLN